MENKGVKIYIDPELYDRLKEASRSEMRSMSNMVGYIIKRYLEERQ